LTGFRRESFRLGGKNTTKGIGEKGKGTILQSQLAKQEGGGLGSGWFIPEIEGRTR